jgi:hyaluronoglucosaminidase
VAGAQDAHQDPFPHHNIRSMLQLGDITVGTVVDWPDMRYRGTVEGYYGIPWSFEARQSQFRFYGRNKMNLYIYAPKDDPLHHGEGCYQPYPEGKAFELAALVRCARENRVRFVWAIHPANTVNWAENEGRTQLDGLCRKLEWMYEIGVRDFGVLVDDSFGEIGKPERQVQLCNYILENFIRKHPDVNQELIMCPTGYNKSWTNEQFLTTIGEGLHKDIHVMWTGNTVVHDITLEGQQWVNPLVKRPTFIWWNWPCNDFKPSRLSMGRTYGLDQDPDMKNQMSGFVANPMERAEASKVGLFGVANYTWNIQDFNSDKTWKDGISRMYPRCASAMQTFCNHNSYLLPNGHGYYREESTDLGDLPNRFRESIVNGTPDEKLSNQMLVIFSSVASAAEKLRDTRDLGPLQSEIDPWIRAFYSMGMAGIDGVRALQTNSLPERMDIFFRMVEKLERIKSLRRNAWVDGKVEQVEDVQVGAFAITPSVMAAYNFLNASIYSELAGGDFRALMPTFSTNMGNEKEQIANLSDNDFNTHWVSARTQQAGDWFCLDFGKNMPIRTLKLLLSDRNNKNTTAGGQLEYSTDNENWTPLGAERTTGIVLEDLSQAPITARWLRFRITQPQVKRRLGVSEFLVNKPLPARLSNTVNGLKSISAYSDETHVALVRVMETAKAAPGQGFGIAFPTPVSGQGLTVNLDNKDLLNWGEVEFTLEDGTTEKAFLQQYYDTEFVVQKKYMPKKRISAIRFTNVSQQDQELRLNAFQITIPSVDTAAMASSLTDCDFSTAYNTGDYALNTELSVPAGTRLLTIVGSAQCQVEGATHINSQGLIHTYRLNQDAESISIRASRQYGTKVYEAIFR